jgi:predicted enzyme related to lactoylglutathione lyase
MTTNPNMPSRVSLLVIGVTDLSRSIDFYNGTLGLEVTNRSEDIAMISASSITLMLSATLGKTIKPGTASIEIVFPVDSVSTAHRLLIEKGCKFMRDPGEVMPGSWRAILTDPDGHLLTVFGGK